MATNFTLTRGEPKREQEKEYVVEREYKRENRKIAALEKELKAHEKTDMAHAHPMRRSHEASQKSAPLPNMRKF